VHAGNLGMRALYRKFGFTATHLTMERRPTAAEPGPAEPGPAERKPAEAGAPEAAAEPAS
jgi:hypothetical protein